MNLDIYLSIKKSGDPLLADARERMEHDAHFQRVIRYFSGITDQLPWEGITWINGLLPGRPRVALEALSAYFDAHMHYLTDSMINAISDAEEVIRARYIRVPESSSELRALLLGLSSREFEQLIEHLYDAMGYQTELTPSQGDGGRDIIARRNEPGRRETLYVECKRYEAKVGVEIIRSLIGVISTELANKGVVVTSSDFTLGSRRLAVRDRRVELIPGTNLISLLNEHLGTDWPARLDRLSGGRPFRSSRQS
jgi:restriction system protein